MIRGIRGYSARSSHLCSFIAWAVFCQVSWMMVAAGADIPRRRAYVTNFGSDSISFFEISRPGRLVKLPGPPMAALNLSTPTLDAGSTRSRLPFLTMRVQLPEYSRDNPCFAMDRRKPKRVTL
jgi:hypothetical protein